MVPAEMREVTDPLRPEDELLTVDELNTVSLFGTLKKGGPDFRKFPSTTILRRCGKGRVICEQGESGATAFYILTTEDVIALKEVQLKELDDTIAEKGRGAPEFEMHPYFAQLSGKELKKRRDDTAAELEELKQRLESLPPAEGKNGPQREVAAAHLLVNMDGEKKKRGLLHRLFGGGGKKSGRKLPAYIPVDGPADIDANSLRGPLHEGEVLGEMSCMNRAPRSATVVAEQDCYMLEILRNVLDMLQKDAAYKKKMDATYRKRIMETHVRRLSVFEALTDQQFESLKEKIELVEFESGETLFEEGDDSDSFFIIRSGLVKVIKNAWYAFRDSEFQDSHWKSFCDECVSSEEDYGELREYVVQSLPDDLAEAVKSKKLTDDQKKSLREALNDFIKGSKVHTDLGKTRREVLDVVDGPQLRAVIAEYPKETGRWSTLEARSFHRAFLETVFPESLPKQFESAGPRRTLAYLGRGDIIGEMGVFENNPRSATCVAYDHPDSGYQQRIPDGRMGAVVSRVELVKVTREVLDEMRKAVPQIESRMQEAVQKRKRAQMAAEAARIGDATTAVPQNREFEQLGLIQGQKLMLIDLDRCTRCNSCVEACVAAHDDGRTRLYLDGPRYDKYLVPLTCRSCMDPVCMIGCPVGSINRGDNGEIVIEDWCIGCRMCAEQCPYGSIQMNELSDPIQLSAEQKAILGEDTSLKAVGQQAVVCDLCSSLTTGKHSCVYACPHDAAMRVNAQDHFLRASGSA